MNEKLRSKAVPHVMIAWCQVSHVRYHVSGVRCQVSGVTCHIKIYLFFFIFFFDNLVELVGGGSVINGAYLV